MSRPSSNVAATSVSFTKAFVPGLIVGLIIGAFAGAFITPLLDRGGEMPVVVPPGSRVGEGETDSSGTPQDDAE